MRCGTRRPTGSCSGNIRPLPLPARPPTRGCCRRLLCLRMTVQKGSDLIEPLLPDLAAGELQLAVIGTGEEKYVKMFNDINVAGAANIVLRAGFDPGLARKIYAASDIFLMPSHFEPCGLGQLIALRYGAVPVVRATGGLADTVIDADRSARRGTGFTFKAYTTKALIATLDRALVAYTDPDRWQALQRRGMAADFSWNTSA